MEPDTAVLIVPLEQCGTAPISLVGSKARHLGEAIAAGLPVPSGAVLTTAAFARWSPPLLDEALNSSRIPRELAEELSAVRVHLGPGPFAVRSSSSAEDLTRASYAGQYATTLGVQGQDELARAVLRTWRSAASASARAYSGDGSGRSEMAVLIQQMVPARAAGVAFTADPVTGDTTTTAVEAVAGLGDALVSGQRTPEEWQVRGVTAQVRRRGREVLLDQSVAIRVAQMARKCEKLLRRPADIEWALSDDGRIHLLQLRAITALPEHETGIPDKVRNGYWQLDTSHFPKPISPLGSSVIMPKAEQSVEEGCASLGLLLDGIRFATVGGWTYTRVVPLGGRDRKAPPPALLWLAIRLHPRIRRRVWSGVRAVQEGRPLQIIRHWDTDGRSQLQTEISRLKDVRLSEIGDQALVEHLRDLDNLLRLGWKTHVPVHTAMVVVLGSYMAAARELLGWDEAEAASLLAGLSTASTAPGRALDVLAGEANASPGVRNALLSEAPDLDAIRKSSPSFGHLFDAYLAEFGCRPLGYDPADPLLEEKPHYVLSLIADRIRGHGHRDSAGEAAKLKARQAADELRGADRARFETALRQAEEVYPVREDNVFYAISTPCGLLHRAGLEAGRRMASRGQLTSPDGAFFLALDELLEALRSGKDTSAIVKRRRDELERSARAVPPAHFGDPPSAPPLSVLPRASRLIHEAFNWYVSTQTTAHPVLGGAGREDAAAADGLLTGTGASAGTYTGRVRLILDESEMDLIEPGDVVVTAATSPTWALVFPRVGALVTNEGGVLSHPAIIAREYGVPAVVGTGSATLTLSEGQLVTVDGTAGTVRAAPSPAAVPTATAETPQPRTTEGALP